MTFVSSSIIRDDWQATKALGEPVPEFQVQWLVEVSDKTDGAEYVLTQCGLPITGQPYQAGSDVNLLAICKSVSVSPLAEKYWRATVSYGPLDGDDDDVKLDEDGENIEDVELQGIDVEMSLVQMTRAAFRGVYLGVIEGIDNPNNVPNANHQWRGGPFPAQNAENLGRGHGAPITNSADVPFDPPPEIDYSRISVRISKNEKNFNANKVAAYNDTVNKDPLQIRFRGFRLDIKPFTAKMQTISASRVIKNGKVFWRTSYEFHIDDRFGWRAELLDRGHSRTGLWDANQAIFIEQSMDEAKNGNWPNVAIKDEDGFTANEPVLLDGQGMPLRKGFKPVYLVYGVYREINWAPLKLTNPGWMI
tara:strand:- start:323 stop:1408 length:1086 start_codon:yes stop_codon:yes gene_type:complete